MTSNPRTGTHRLKGGLGKRAESPGRRGRVYLVEDDPVERARMADLLERAGYEVVVVATLEAAVTEGFWSGDPAKLLFVSRSGQHG